MKLADNQPDNVCFDCGEQWGLRPLKTGESHRVWIDKCDVCNDLKPVCDASEYGYMQIGWDAVK